MPPCLCGVRLCSAGRPARRRQAPALGRSSSLEAAPSRAAAARRAMAASCARRCSARTAAGVHGACRRRRARWSAAARSSSGPAPPARPVRRPPLRCLLARSSRLPGSRARPELRRAGPASVAASRVQARAVSGARARARRALTPCTPGPRRRIRGRLLPGRPDARGGDRGQWAAGPVGRYGSRRGRPPAGALHAAPAAATRAADLAALPVRPRPEARPLTRARGRHPQPPSTRVGARPRGTAQHSMAWLAASAGPPGHARALCPARTLLRAACACLRPQALLRGAEPRGGGRQGVAGAGGRGRGAAGALRCVQPVRHVRPGQRRPGRGRRRRARAPGAPRAPRRVCRLATALGLPPALGVAAAPPVWAPLGCLLCSGPQRSARGPGVGLGGEGPRECHADSAPWVRGACERTHLHASSTAWPPVVDQPRRAGEAGAVCDRLPC